MTLPLLKLSLTPKKNRIMKKYLIFAAATLVAGIACSKVETENAAPDVEIGFQVASYLNQTKAVTDSHGHTSFVDELTEVGAASKYFKSAAYIHAAKADGTVEAPAAFFTAGSGNVETINYDGSSTWKPAHPYYWPKSPKSSLSFFSWYDFGDQVTPTIIYTADGGTATLAWGDRTVALKDNVMFADAAYHYKQNANTSQEHKLDGVTEGVPTLFRHALAKVRFTVKQSPMKVQDGSTGNYTFWEVKLSEVKLSSGTIKDNGKFSLTQTSSTAATTQVEWTKPAIWEAPTGSQTYLSAKLGNEAGDIFDTDVARGVDGSSNPVYLTNDAVSLTGTNFMAGNYFTVMPQEIGDEVTLTFKYTIDTWYGTEDKFAVAGHTGCSHISTETVDVNTLAGAGYGTPYVATGIQLNAITGASTRWEMNHRYVYNIVINPQTSEIKYDPAVETWAEESSASQTVPAA